MSTHVPRNVAAHILGACVMDPVPAGNTRARRTGKTGGGGNPARRPKIPLRQDQAPSRTILASSAERDRRLYRECRGLPNAGACLGYAALKNRHKLAKPQKTSLQSRFRRKASRNPGSTKRRFLKCADFFVLQFKALAAVAQLDRVLGYGTKGSWVRFLPAAPNAKP